MQLFSFGHHTLTWYTCCYHLATQTTDWMLHLSTVRAMLPWYFAYDRINYARYMSTYWPEMICLDKTHPGKVMNMNMFHIYTVSTLSKSVKCLLYTFSATKFDANAIEQFFLVFLRCICRVKLEVESSTSAKVWIFFNCL